MIGENRQLITDELVEVQDGRRLTDHFRGIYRINHNLIKGNRKMSTCNRLDLGTLGYWLVRSKNLLRHKPPHSHIGCHHKAHNSFPPRHVFSLLPQPHRASRPAWLVRDPPGDGGGHLGPRIPLAGWLQPIRSATSQPGDSMGLSYPAMDGRPHSRESPTPARLVGHVLSTTTRPINSHLGVFSSTLTCNFYTYIRI